MEYNKFTEEYKPIRNTFNLTSPLENTLFENDEEQIEFIEEKDENCIWTYTDKGLIKNGLFYGNNVIGYIVTKKPWNDIKKGSLNINM